MKKINSIRLMLIMALSNFTFLSASAADVYLSSNGNDANTGTSSEQAVLTLRKAFDLSGQVGTIYVSGTVDGYSGQNGTYGTCYFSSNTANLTIQGLSSDAKIVTNSAGRIFYLRSDAQLLLKNLKLSGTQGQSVTFDGAGIFMGGGSLTAENVIFENFSTTTNGGVINVTALSTANPLLACKNCVFQNNQAATTGSNVGFGSVLRVNDEAAANAKIYFENCSFLNNQALYGTTFFRQGTAPSPYPVIIFVNSTFKGNSNGNGNSGCVTGYSANQTIKIINCTVKDNTGIGIRFTAAHTGIINNSIVEGNNTYDLSCDNSPVVTVNNSFINVFRNLTGYTKPTGYTSANQLLAAFDATTNSYTPVAGSLAINFGSMQYLQNLGTDGTKTINYDQLNNSRLFVSDKCDAGAIEIVKITTALEIGKTNELKIYQSGQEILVDSKNVSSIQLISVSGSVVKKSLTNQISLSGIYKGLYIVKVEAGAKSYVQKLVLR